MIMSGLTTLIYNKAGESRVSDDVSGASDGEPHEARAGLGVSSSGNTGQAPQTTHTRQSLTRPNISIRPGETDSWEN